MKPTTRWTVILLAGLALLVAPAAIRVLWLGFNQRAYQPPAVARPVVAATPHPTATPVAAALPPPVPVNELRRGPIVVDLAHYSLIEREKMQPLSAALAARSLDLRYWMPSVETANIQNITAFPDLSEELSKQLADATGLVVVSPFFLYSPNEIAVVEQFVSDGGRLLIVSDPDIESDAARDTNILATAFNVVFNEDYLYDTVKNDDNYTYFFQEEFHDRAEPLSGSQIVFYGARSIGGAIVPQIRSAATTLSSLRNGLTSFNTVAIGGTVADDSIGRVLAMSDFDVLTDPFVTRYDNWKMVEFVADFLSGAQREHTIADFPAFLAKEVALVIDNTQPVGALALSKAAELQRFLEASGRTLSLVPNTWLTEPGADESRTDLIYVAGYRAADSMTPLLGDLGIELVEEVITPTVTAVVTAEVPPTLPEGVPALTPVPSTTPEPEVAPHTTPEVTPKVAPVITPETTPITATVELDLPLMQAEPVTPTFTPTPAAPVLSPMLPPFLNEQAEVTPESAGPAPEDLATATPIVKLYLERKDGIRLVADETQLFIQRPYHYFQRILAVLGNNEQSINAGVTRLLNQDLAGCLTQDELVICPVSTGAAAAPGSASGSPAAAQSTPAPTEEAGGHERAAGSILIVDDNTAAHEGEKSEAAIYLVALTAAGHKVDQWVTNEQGMPDTPDMAGYAWVIWSDAGYTSSGIGGEALRVISNHINQGGRVTISSRMPFFGVGGLPPSPIRDVVVADGVPELVAGLPTEPILLQDNLPPLTPLESEPEPSTGARMAMLRGPASESSGAPVLAIYSDENFEEPKGALLMLMGMSMGWLPEEVSTPLIENMATVMLAE